MRWRRSEMSKRSSAVCARNPLVDILHTPPLWFSEWRRVHLVIIGVRPWPKKWELSKRYTSSSQHVQNDIFRYRNPSRLWTVDIMTSLRVLRAAINPTIDSRLIASLEVFGLRSFQSLWIRTVRSTYSSQYRIADPRTDHSVGSSITVRL